MLADSGAQTHGGRRATAARAAALRQRDRADPLRRRRSRLPAPTLGNHPAPDDLAMILYTSGSTGRPKGVDAHAIAPSSPTRATTPTAGASRARDRCCCPPRSASPARCAPSTARCSTAPRCIPYDAGRTASAGCGVAAGQRDHHRARASRRPFAASWRRWTTTRRFRRSRLSVGGEPMLRSDVDYFNRHFPPHCVCRTGSGRPSA